MMKKIGLLLFAIVCTGIFTNSYAQKDRKLSNGFSINAVMGIPSAEYGLAKDDEVSSDYALGSLWGLQLGNRWYFSPTEQFGIGLMVNWADITFSGKAGTEGNVDWGRAAFDLTFIELGPVGTIALTDDIAIDGYYNLRPTWFGSALVIMDISGFADDETFAYAGFGFSHAIGAAFRWKALNIGVEYVLGSINSVGSYTGSYDISLEDKKNQTNSLRIMLGVKL
jgi:hypothetical protein